LACDGNTPSSTSTATVTEAIQLYLSMVFIWKRLDA
jgi:hypothetical protein